MEREIIFRAKAVNTEMWAYGDLVHNQKVTKEGLEPRTMVGGYEVYKDTIGQFTGLKDKNGKELYARRHKLSEEQEEFEAESVAWLVCKRLGIPTDSEYYLSHYCTKNGTIPQVSPDAILRAADAIERLMSEDWKDNIWEKLILEKGGNPDYREKVKVPQQTLFRRRA